jgi:hypothetical protein
MPNKRRGEKRNTHEVQHNLAKQHILEGTERLSILVITLCRKVLKRLIKVGVCCGVVFIFSVQDPALEVE